MDGRSCHSYFQQQVQRERDEPSHEIRFNTTHSHDVCLLQAPVGGHFISLSDVRASGAEPQDPGRVLSGSVVRETEAGNVAGSVAAALQQKGNKTSSEEDENIKVSVSPHQHLTINRQS